ncbi:MAG: hypothetical protein ACXABO_12020 [Promethearchaeota archaeon]|jgi:hypothetical protein
MEDELEELKELSIAKIKVVHNRTVDIEATHMILWDKSDKTRKIRLISALLLSILVVTLINLVLIQISFIIAWQLILMTDLFTILVMGLIIWESIARFKGEGGDHGRIVNGALRLRDQSNNFLQYKLDNLDKQGYIDELKTLEINDTHLIDISSKYAKKLSKKSMILVNKKVADLEQQGIKKYFMIQEEIDSANEKLQKFSALRTCVAWIHFK